eukprot:COSAG06_NODE_70972_length_188_cov_1424.022472_1_plen_22_part_01
MVGELSQGSTPEQRSWGSFVLR